MNLYRTSLKFTITLAIIYGFYTCVFASDQFIYDEDFSYDKFTILTSFNLGYSYPISSVSTVGGGYNFNKTRSTNIYNPGIAFNFRQVGITNPLIIGYNFAIGYAPITAKGKELINQRFSDHQSSISATQVFIGFNLGVYVYENSFLACYIIASPSYIELDYDGKYDSSKKTTPSITNELWGVTGTCGVELRPFEDKHKFISLEGSYLVYRSNKIMPQDIRLYFGFGVNLSLIDIGNIIFQ
jgi:hypothetical protein